MNFLKNITKHYEKVLLGTVLLGLVVAVILLPFKVSGDQQALRDKLATIAHPKIKEMTNLDLSVHESVLARSKSPAGVSLSAPPHNVFNPVAWGQRPDGTLYRIERGAEGPERVEVTGVSNLFLTIAFDSVGASGSNYLITVERETEVQSNKRKRSQYVALNGKTDLFALREVRGPSEKPTELVLEMNESGDRFSIAPAQPYRKVDGYTASLKYDPEKKTWTNRRVGSVLNLAGGDYVLSAINPVATNQYEVVLSAKLSGKKTTIKYNVAP
jgi:hypothetical protein